MVPKTVKLRSCPYCGKAVSIVNDTIFKNDVKCKIVCGGCGAETRFKQLSHNYDLTSAAYNCRVGMFMKVSDPASIISKVTEILQDEFPFGRRMSASDVKSVLLENADKLK